MSIIKNTSIKKEPSILKIFLSLLCLIILRIFIENFSNPGVEQGAFDVISIISIVLYFFSVFFSLLLLLWAFTKESFFKISLFLIYVHPLILLPPILDILINGSRSGSLSFISLKKTDIIPSFFNFMLPAATNGISIGLYISLIFLFITIGFFVFKKSHSYLKSALTLFMAYCIFFSYATLPVGIITFTNNFFYNIISSPTHIYYLTLENSWILKDGSETIISTFRDEYLHGVFLAHVFWISLLFQIILCFFIFKRKESIIFLKNIRIERIFNYLILAIIGIFLSRYAFGPIHLENHANIIILIAFFLLFILNAILAILINDEEDISIDKISNPDRPLSSDALSAKDWSTIKSITILLFLTGLASFSNNVIFLIILSQAAYYIYSAYPLRLKRHFISSSILMGTATLATSMAGFYLVSKTQSMFSFPLKAILLIGLGQALLSNVKDIKDYAGDKANNIKTIPVVFGEKNGKIIIATLWSVVFISVPIILNISYLITSSLFISFLTFYLITKKEYQEKYIFMALFLYMLILFLATL